MSIQHRVAPRTLTLLCLAALAFISPIRPTSAKAPSLAVKPAIDRANTEIKDGNYAAALKILNDTLLTTTNADDRHALMAAAADTDYRIAASDLDSNQPTDALSSYKAAYEIDKELRPTSIEEDLDNIGSIYLNLRQYDKAVDTYRQLLSTSNANADNVGVEIALTSIANIYTKLGEYDKAIDFDKHFVALVQARGDKVAGEEYTEKISLAYLDLSQYKTSLTFSTQALVEAKKDRDNIAAERDLDYIGFAYMHLDQNDNALVYYYQALDVANDLDDKKAQENILSNIGGTYAQLGQYNQALNYDAQSLARAWAIGNPPSEAADLNNLMSVAQSLSRTRLAIFYGKEAVNIYQSIPTEAASLAPGPRKSYLAKVQKTYLKLASILSGQGRQPEADQVIALLKDGEGQTLPLNPDEQTAASEEARKIDEINYERSRPGADTDIESPHDALAQAEAAYEIFIGAELPTEFNDTADD